MNFWLHALQRQTRLSSTADAAETGAGVAEAVLGGGGVVDLESLLDPEDAWVSGGGGDMVS